MNKSGCAVRLGNGGLVRRGDNKPVGKYKKGGAVCKKCGYKKCKCGKK